MDQFELTISAEQKVTFSREYSEWVKKEEQKRIEVRDMVGSLQAASANDGKIAEIELLIASKIS